MSEHGTDIDPRTPTPPPPDGVQLHGYGVWVRVRVAAADMAEASAAVYSLLEGRDWLGLPPLAVSVDPGADLLDSAPCIVCGAYVSGVTPLEHDYGCIYNPPVQGPRILYSVYRVHPGGTSQWAEDHETAEAAIASARAARYWSAGSMHYYAAQVETNDCTGECHQVRTIWDSRNDD